MRTSTVEGQSLIEVVFAIGVLVMVITAVASLIVKTTGIKSETAQRKKASEMSEIIVEDLLNSKKNNPDSFWQLNDVATPQTVAGYEGYQYLVDFSQNSDGDCSSTVVECADATVTISWGNGQTFTVKRFFTKKN